MTNFGVPAAANEPKYLMENLYEAHRRFMIAYLTAALILIAFAILPGTWLVYTLPLAPLRRSARLALAIALSPAVLALEVLLLKAFQIPFATIPTVLLFANLPALFFLIRGWRSAAQPVERPTVIAWLGGGALLALLGTYLALPWRLVPSLRTFAWHALWHTDIAYALTRNSLLPEEPELAGMRLSYTWTGHFFWSVTGWLTNLPPTVLYAVTNVIWLLAAVLLAYALCRDGLRLSRPLALLGSGTIFLGTNIAGTLAWIYARDWQWQQHYFGDLRYTPMLGKYLGFETMPFAFALMIGVAFVTTLALQQRLRHLWAILTALLVALGLLYPILFPAGCLIVGVLWLLLLLQQFELLSPSTAHYSWQSLIALALGGIASVVVTFGFLQLVTLDGSNAPIHLAALAAMKEKSVQVVVALMLFTPGLFYIVTALRRRSGPGLLLFGATLGLMALYVVADLATLEYKYVLAATIVLAPVGAAGVATLLRRPALQWVAALGVLSLLVGANQLLMLQIGAQIPANLVNAPAVDETGFWLQLQPDQAEAGWVRAIRTETPENTIVVATDSHIHVSPFLERSLYAPSDADGTKIAGYSVENRYNLLSWRGYSPALYDGRLAAVQALQGDAPDQWAQALLTMLTLERPLAIHLTTDRPLVAWLQAQQMGTELYATEQDVVWMVEPSTTTLSVLESVGEHASR